MTTIDRDPPIPLYYQLKQILIDKIARGEWGADVAAGREPIPTEQQLQKDYGLSRTTVRQALSELVHEGRLVRYRGRGTFVAATPKYAHSPNQQLSLSQHMVQAGVRPGWRVLDVELIAVPEDVQEQLQLDADDRVLRIRRLRLADDTPIGYHVAYVPESIAGQINHDALSDGQSIGYLRHLPQLAGAQVQRTLEAVAANADEARLLHMREGEPILLVARLVVGADGTPIEYMEASYRGDQFKYQLSLPISIYPSVA